MIQSDPVFGAAVAEIREQAAEEIEAEIQRRGKDGWLEPIVQKGQQATLADGSPAFLRRYSDHLLLARARALMPAKYSEKRQIEHTGTIHHSTGHLSITSADLAALDPDQRAHLQGILQTIQTTRKGNHAAPAIAHQPADVVDAEFEEVTPPKEDAARVVKRERKI